MMLEPTKFQVGDALVIFQANDAPIPTDQGDVDTLFVMDVRSAYIMEKLVVIDGAEPQAEEIRATLKRGLSQGRGLRWPKIIYVARELTLAHLADAIEGETIEIVRADESDLKHIIGDAQKAFRKRFEKYTRSIIAETESVRAPESQDSERSPYAPVRLRGQGYWVFARQAANAGAINRNGLVSADLHARIDQTLIEPTIQFVKQALDRGELNPHAVGGVLAKSSGYHDWVPMAGQFELCGRQIFDLHDHLTELLSHTDLGEVTLEALHTPYDAFYVRFGQRRDVKLQFDVDSWEYVDGAFVAFSPWDNATGASRLKIGFTTVHEDGSGVMYPGYFFDLLPDELRLPVPQAIDTALRRRSAAADEEMQSAAALGSHIKGEVEDAAELLKSSAALLINSLFYLESIREQIPAASPGRDWPPSSVAEWMKSSPSHRRTLRSNMNADGYTVVYLVGEEVDKPGLSSAGAGVNMKVHWRRGHWRMQRHGPKLLLVKRIWIRPVLVGADHVASSDEVPGHLYVAPTSNVVQ